jgi:hypothetical protein
MWHNVRRSGVPSISRFFEGRSPQRPAFEAWRAHVTFVLTKNVLGRLPFRVLTNFPPSVPFHQCSHSYLIRLLSTLCNLVIVKCSEMKHLPLLILRKWKHSVGQSVGRSVGWSVGRLVGRLEGWSVGRLVCCLLVSVVSIFVFAKSQFKSMLGYAYSVLCSDRWWVMKGERACGSFDTVRNLMNSTRETPSAIVY